MVNYLELVQAEKKGWVKKTTPIQVKNLSFQPWKIVNDDFYESKVNAIWFLDNLPRSLVTVHNIVSGDLVQIFYGLKKFGSIEDKLMGSNQRIRQLILENKPIELQVYQKHNGEAATISGIVIEDEFYYVIMSKSVPAIVKNRKELLKLDPVRFKTCIEIGVQLFDLVEKLPWSKLIILTDLLTKYMLPIEKIDKEFKHIACENFGLYILGIRSVTTLKLIFDKVTLDYLITIGFFSAKKFTQEYINKKIQTVYDSYITLPNTPDKPTQDEFINYLTGNDMMSNENFIKIWSYVSLVHEQIAHSNITAIEMLQIASGQNHEKINLIEGTIISIYDKETDEVYMIKDKDLYYYLLRSVRTIVEHYKERKYTGSELNSKSMVHWKKYLIPQWLNAWNEFLTLVSKYMCSYDFVKIVEINYLKARTGGIDAPDFYAAVLKWTLDPSQQNIHKPIIIITTESEINTIKYLANNIYRGKLPDNLPNGTVNILYECKLNSLADYNNKKKFIRWKNGISFIRYTCLYPKLISDKKILSFWNDLVSENCDLPICVSQDDLEIEILRAQELDVIIDNSTKENELYLPPSITKLQYFDNKFIPDITSISVYSDLMDMMVQLNTNYSGKFDNNINPEQIKLALDCLNFELILRNPQAVTKMTDSILSVYNNKSNDSNNKLVIFVTGLPGIGKDYCAEQTLININKLKPEIICKVINQDMFQGDSLKYINGLDKIIQSSDIIIITRNGAGSSRSLDICKKYKTRIHLICPHDSQPLMLLGSIQYALKRKETDITNVHTLTNLKPEKIISIICNFFTSLSQSNQSILGITNSKYLGIIIDNKKHVTLEYGIITRGDLVNTDVQITQTKIITVEGPDNYMIKFATVNLFPKELEALIESNNPHITLEKSGLSKPLHSGWWAHIADYFCNIDINLKNLDSIGEINNIFDFGQFKIKVEELTQPVILTGKIQICG